MRRIYLDYAATTPLRPEAKAAMLPFLDEKFGNAGSLHSFGQEAIAALDKSRETFAKILKTGFRNIVFTSSATEANNLALRGAIKKWKKSHTGNPRLIISSIEHESILETARSLGEEKIDVVILPVDRSGIVSLKSVLENLTPETVLVSIMYVNNEVGTVQDIKNIGVEIRNFRKSAAYPLFHTDAAQAFHLFPSIPEELNVDLMTLSSHKICGPKGAALLYMKSPELLSPLITGGGQEFGLRSGTENIPAIIGFAEAASLADAERQVLAARLEKFSRGFLEKLKEYRSDIEINGPVSGNNRKAPHILNIRVPGKLAEAVLTALDLRGVAAASGSACKSRSMEPSHVLRAMGRSASEARESLRFSFGHLTTQEEIDTGSIIVGETIK